MHRVLALSCAAIVASSSACLAWTGFSRTDPITGKSRVGIYLVAGTTTIRPERGPTRTNSKAEIVIVCQDGKLAMYYSINGALVAGRLRNQVDYRFDDAKPVSTTSWRSTQESDGIGLWTNDAVVRFVNEAVKHKTLALRTTAPVFGKTESYFDLSLLRAAVQQVMIACKIKNGPKL